MPRFHLRLLAILALAPVAGAQEPTESLLETDPAIPVPRVVRTFPPRLLNLWMEALERPDSQARCNAAQAISKAHRLGMTGLNETIPLLNRELERADSHPAVALAAAQALVELNAKESAPIFFRIRERADADLREILEPALFQWDHAPAREVWKERLNESQPRGRPVILAIRGLARDESAIPRLLEIVRMTDASAAVRLEAVRTFGELKTSGSESEAVEPWLLVYLLRRHDGPDTVKRLQSLGREADGSVAAVALARLIELDPANALPLLDSAFASGDPGVRKLGVQILLKKPSDAPIVQLGLRLNDPHPEVRTAAKNALKQLASQFRPAVLRECDRALAGQDWRGREQGAILAGQLQHKPGATTLTKLLPDPRPEVAVAAAWSLRILAVPETFRAILEFFQQYCKMKFPPEWRDHQLAELAQLFGLAKYAPAEPVLRSLVPANPSGGVLVRSSAIWALGKYHEGKPDAALAEMIAGRLAAVNPFDLESELLRRMCAVALGRMKADVPQLQTFATDGKITFNRVNNACLWATATSKGDKLPAAGDWEYPQRSWFLSPLD